MLDTTSDITQAITSGSTPDSMSESKTPEIADTAVQDVSTTTAESPVNKTAAADNAQSAPSIIISFFLLCDVSDSMSCAHVFCAHVLLCQTQQAVSNGGGAGSLWACGTTTSKWVEEMEVWL